jgi:uroporphyrin-III C-methyltransferase/precorrin-2 dehydrogenase/sirohydrochlorin ferrochelatase
MSMSAAPQRSDTPGLGPENRYRHRPTPFRMSASASLFPAFLKLTGRRVVVVGGGPVATSKLRGLLDVGAAVTVVAPEVTGDIIASRVPIRRRRFEPADLDDAWLVVAAAPPAVNREVAEAAEHRQVFVNAVDDPTNASLYLGGVFRRGGVTVAISTDGHAPAVAGLIRQALEALLPEPEVERWMATARVQRAAWTSENVPMERRRPLLLQALSGLYEDQG